MLRCSAGAAAIAVGLTFAGSIGAQPVLAADYTMAIAHILPEDMNNEVHPALTHFKTPIAR